MSEPTVVQIESVGVVLMRIIVKGILIAVLSLVASIVFLGESIRFSKAQEIKRQVDTYKAANPNAEKVLKKNEDRFLEAVENVFWGIRRNESLTSFGPSVAARYSGYEDTTGYMAGEAFTQLGRMGLIAPTYPGASRWYVTPLGLSMRSREESNTSFVFEWLEWAPFHGEYFKKVTPDQLSYVIHYRPANQSQ